MPQLPPDELIPIIVESALIAISAVAEATEALREWFALELARALVPWFAAGERETWVN